MINFKSSQSLFGVTKFNSIKEFRVEMINQSLIYPIEDFVFRGVALGKSYELIPNALRKNSNMSSPFVLS